jgi:hypothetical protein
MKVFVVLSYTSDSCNGDLEGIYSTKRLAFQKAMTLRAKQSEQNRWVRRHFGSRSYFVVKIEEKIINE